MRTDTSAVAADMERIFAPLADRPVRRRGAIAVAPRRRGSRSKVALALVAAVGAIAAVAVAYDFGAVPAVRPVPQAARAPAGRPAGSETPPPPVAQLAIAAPAPTAAPSPLATVALAPAAAPERTGRRPEAQADTAPRDRDPRCDDDECLYREVLAADARLRDAYERAAGAGVSPDWLADVNRRWQRTRHRSQDDPDGVIARYNRMADALDAERQDPSR